MERNQKMLAVAPQPQRSQPSSRAEKHPATGAQAGPLQAGCSDNVFDHSFVSLHLMRMFWVVQNASCRKYM